MPRHQRYRTNEPNVIHELIDGEVLIANLGNGLYFSAFDSGAATWLAIANGWSIVETAQIMADRFSEESDQVAAALEPLVNQFLEETLIIPDDSVSRGPLPDLDAVFGKTSEKFSAPELSKYSDMEQLLLMDPIHEVDDGGWPGKPQATTS